MIVSNVWLKFQEIQVISLPALMIEYLIKFQGDGNFGFLEYHAIVPIRIKNQRDKSIKKFILVTGIFLNHSIAGYTSQE